MYPTYAMVNHDGEVTDRWAGYPGVAGFKKITDAALADRRTIAEKNAAYTEQPTLGLALALGQYSEAVFASVDAVGYYRVAMKLAPELAGELSDKVFMSMFYGVRSGVFKPSDVVAEGRDLLAHPDVSMETALTVAGVSRRLASEDEYRGILKSALDATAGATGDLGRARRELEVDEALLLENDPAKALDIKRSLLPEGWRDDPGELNSFAWWCFENDLNLDEAYELAMRGVELSGSDGDKANILDTAAEIAFKQGRVDKAIELESRAVELSPDRDAFKQTLDRFKAGK